MLSRNTLAVAGADICACRCRCLRAGVSRPLHHSEVTRRGCLPAAPGELQAGVSGCKVSSARMQALHYIVHVCSLQNPGCLAGCLCLCAGWGPTKGHASCLGVGGGAVMRLRMLATAGLCLAALRSRCLYIAHALFSCCAAKMWLCISCSRAFMLCLAVAAGTDVMPFGSAALPCACHCCSAGGSISIQCMPQARVGADWDSIQMAALITCCCWLSCTISIVHICVKRYRFLEIRMWLSLSELVWWQCPGSGAVCVLCADALGSACLSGVCSYIRHARQSKVQGGPGGMSWGCLRIHRSIPNTGCAGQRGNVSAMVELTLFRGFLGLQIPGQWVPSVYLPAERVKWGAGYRVCGCGLWFFGSGI